jgi:hypothetical protein
MELLIYCVLQQQVIDILCVAARPCGLCQVRWFSVHIHVCIFINVHKFKSWTYCVLQQQVADILCVVARSSWLCQIRWFSVHIHVCILIHVHEIKSLTYCVLQRGPVGSVKYDDSVCIYMYVYLYTEVVSKALRCSYVMCCSADHWCIVCCSKALLTLSSTMTQCAYTCMYIYACTRY